MKIKTESLNASSLRHLPNDTLLELLATPEEIEVLKLTVIPKSPYPAAVVNGELGQDEIAAEYVWVSNAPA